MDNVGSGVETVDVGCDDDCGCCLLVVVDVVIVFVSSETITVDATGGVIVIVVVVSEESKLMLMLLLINLPLVPLVLVVVYHVLFIGSGHFYIYSMFSITYALIRKYLVLILVRNATVRYGTRS